MTNNNQNDSVVFYAYPKLIFTWPLIAIGPLFWLLAPSTPAEFSIDNKYAAELNTGAISGDLRKDFAINGLELSPEAKVEQVQQEPADGDGDAKEAAPKADVAGSWLIDDGGVWLSGYEITQTDMALTVRPDYRFFNDPETLAWLYLLCVMLVLLTLGVDLERNHAFVWLVLFCAFYFAGRWLADFKGFTFFGDIYRLFANQNIAYDRGFGLTISILLALPFAVMFLWSRLQHKWRITHNEFEHYSWGRADDSLARGAKRVRSTYPDLLELLLAGAGTLVVYSATGRQELRRIHHVPFLFWVRRRINRLLEKTAVTADATIEEEVEAEHAEEGDASSELEEAGPIDVEGGEGGIGGDEPL